MQIQLYTAFCNKSVFSNQNRYFSSTLTSSRYVFQHQKLFLSQNRPLASSSPKCADPTLYSLQFAATKTVSLKQNLHFTSNVINCVFEQKLTFCVQFKLIVHFQVSISYESENDDFEPKSVFHIQIGSYLRFRVFIAYRNQFDITCSF